MNQTLSRTLGGLLLTIVAASSAAAYTELSWLQASGGAVPQGAMIAGVEASGAPLYLCGVVYNGGYHTGKVRPGFSGCNIGYGGKEVTVKSYDIAAGRATWVAASGDNIPRDAFGAGFEASGAPLYICRASYKGGTHPGKARPGFHGCNIGYGGKEITVRDYEVIVN